MSRDATAAVVARVIAETFGVAADRVTRATTADDVDGWDSLSHTILLVRLGRALGAAVPEAAADAATVGELIDALDAVPP